MTREEYEETKAEIFLCMDLDDERELKQLRKNLQALKKEFFKRSNN